MFANSITVVTVITEVITEIIAPEKECFILDITPQVTANVPLAKKFIIKPYTPVSLKLKNSKRATVAAEINPYNGPYKKDTIAKIKG